MALLGYGHKAHSDPQICMEIIAFNPSQWIIPFFRILGVPSIFKSVNYQSNCAFTEAWLLFDILSWRKGEEKRENDYVKCAIT